MAKRQARSYLLPYLRPFFLTLSLVTLCSMGMAFLGSLLGAIVGPSFQALTSGSGSTELAFAELFGPYLGSAFAWAFDIQSVSAATLVSVVPLGLLVGGGIKALLTFCQIYYWESAGERISSDIRSRVMNGFLKVDPEVLKEDAGQSYWEKISSTLSTDIRYLKEYVVRFYGGIPRELLQCVFYAVTLILLSPRLFAVFFVGIVPAGILISRVGRTLKKRANRALSDFSEVTEWIQQRLSGLLVIKHYGTERLESSKFAELSNTLYYRFYKAARSRAKSSLIIHSFVGLGLGLVVYFALQDVENEVLSGSVILSFLSTLGLMSQSIIKFNKYYNTNREAAAAVDRIRLLEQFSSVHSRASVGIPEAPESQESPVLSIRDVWYTYPGQDQAALRDVQCDFKVGTKYCICGPSGAGKSTLAGVILGLLRPQQGDVFISAANENGETKEGEPSLIGLIPQSVSLAAATVAQTVAYPVNQGIDRKKVQAALDRVGLSERVHSMRDGLDEKVGPGGTTVSGGEAQRFLLARLWYHRFPVVLVDEGTSALDPESERLIYQGLEELAERGTVVIMIAHRPSTVAFADEVVFMKDGEIVFVGDGQELRQEPAPGEVEQDTL